MMTQQHNINWTIVKMNSVHEKYKAAHWISKNMVECYCLYGGGSINPHIMFADPKDATYFKIAYTL